MSVTAHLREAVKDNNLRQEKYRIAMAIQPKLTDITGAKSEAVPATKDPQSVMNDVRAKIEDENHTFFTGKADRGSVIRQLNELDQIIGDALRASYRKLAQEHYQHDPKEAGWPAWLGLPRSAPKKEDGKRTEGTYRSQLQHSDEVS